MGAAKSKKSRIIGSGFVGIPRDIFDIILTLPPQQAKVYLYLIAQARWQTEAVQLKDTVLQQGQVVTTLRLIAEAIKPEIRRATLPNPGSIRRILTRLTVLNLIFVHTSASFQLITVRNYKRFTHTGNTQATDRQQRGNREATERQLSKQYNNITREQVNLIQTPSVEGVDSKTENPLREAIALHPSPNAPKNLTRFIDELLPCPPSPEVTTSAVWLTRVQWQSLIMRLGSEACAQYWCDSLDRYRTNSPHKYKNLRDHFDAIVSWHGMKLESGKVFSADNENGPGYYPAWQSRRSA